MGETSARTSAIPSRRSHSNDSRWMPMRAGSGRTSAMLEKETSSRPETMTSGKTNPSCGDALGDQIRLAGDGTATGEYTTASERLQPGTLARPETLIQRATTPPDPAAFPEMVANRGPKRHSFFQGARP